MITGGTFTCTLAMFFLLYEIWGTQKGLYPPDVAHKDTLQMMINPLIIAKDTRYYIHTHCTYCIHPSHDPRSDLSYITVRGHQKLAQHILYRKCTGKKQWCVDKPMNYSPQKIYVK